MPDQPIRHRRLALVLVVLGCIVAFVAMFSVWVNRQVLNTDNWTATSSQLLEQKVIRDQVAGFLVDQLYENVDVEAEIRNALPPRAQPLAGPAAGALRTFAERAARELLARPRAQLAWEGANRNAHELLLRVLDGGGSVVSTNGGVVVLDLKSLLEETQARIGIGGRVAARLPDDAAEITILRSDQLAAAQDGLKILRPLPIVLVSLSLLLFAIALIISPGWRRKAVRAYGIGFIAAGALGLAAIAILSDTVVGSLAKTEAAEPAIEATMTIGTSLLHEIAVSTIGYGVLMWLGALLAGPTTRRHRDPALPGAVSARAGDRLRRVPGAPRHRHPVVGADAGHAQPRHRDPAGHPDRHRLRGPAPSDRPRVPGRRPQGRGAARPRAARPRVGLGPRVGERGPRRRGAPGFRGRGRGAGRRPSRGARAARPPARHGDARRRGVPRREAAHPQCSRALKAIRNPPIRPTASACRIEAGTLLPDRRPPK